MWRALGVYVRIESGGATHVGRIRANNEDSYRIVAPLNLFVLSDGMGGEAYGEVASALAVETVAALCSETLKGSLTPFQHRTSPELSAETRLLINAVRLANRKIHEAAQASAEHHGMGATMTTAWVVDQRLSLAHVGDSRAYLFRAGNLVQLTQDHSLVAEQVRRGMLTAQQAESSEMQSVLLRALGAQAEVEVDTEEIPLIANDVLLLCSDGLTRMLTEPEIATTLGLERDAQRAAERLVSLANDAGGFDNITVVVARFKKTWDGWLSRLLRGGRGRRRSDGANQQAQGRSHEEEED
jgi:protein phosphatase